MPQPLTKSQGRAAKFVDMLSAIGGTMGLLTGFSIRAAKFVDMLSAIGGTMGLLTGFSIISGVEIVYFCIKIILKILKDKHNKK